MLHFTHSSYKFLAFFFLLSYSTRAAEKPNIIFILCDDLGYGDVGVFYQNQRAAKNDRSLPFFTTPRLDQMASQGTMLTQHYCAAPVCAPSRASLLTGLTQGHANVRDNQFDKALADTHTLGSVLKEAGYATAAIGKWGLQGKSPIKAENKRKGKAETAKGQSSGKFPDWIAYPTKRGFDYYYGYVRHVDGHFHYPKEDGREIWENEHEVSDNLDLCYTTDLFTARAKKWIIEQTRQHTEQPFFLYLAYDTPHAVLQNPSSAYPEGGGLKGGVQWLGEPKAMINTATGKMDGWMHPDFINATWDHDRNPSTEEVPWPETQKRYANGVRRIDDSVGDILTLLADLKIADNTLVVFTSDNGPSKESYLKKKPFKPNFFRGFGPFDGIKRDTLEGGLREPTIVSWPRFIPAGSINAEPSGHWDWLSTFTEAAGLTPPAASDGVSLLASLTKGEERKNGILYMEYFNPNKTPSYPEFAATHHDKKRGQMQAIFVDGYKGLRYDVKSASQDFEIYDVIKDPQETQNLAKKAEFAKLQKRMKASALQSRMPSANAPRPYDKALTPASPQSPDTQVGISWQTYQGDWPWMPNFRMLSTVLEGNSSSFDLSTIPSHDWAGISFEGYLRILTDGEYTFALKSTGGTMLFIHDKRVIDEGKLTGNNKRSTIPLEAGWHPLRLLHRRIQGSTAFEFSITDKNGKTLPLNEKNLKQAKR